MRPLVADRIIDILLIEDNPADARLTAEAFKEGRLRHRLTVARDGVEALEMLRGGVPQPWATRPDLILLDLNLPRMDGREVLAAIKSDDQLRRIPVIILTTSAAEEDIQRCYDLHSNCFITKPVDIDDFIDVVKIIEAFWFRVVQLPGF